MGHGAVDCLGEERIDEEIGKRGVGVVRFGDVSKEDT
jgi:hypothetical protein